MPQRIDSRGLSLRGCLPSIEFGLDYGGLHAKSYTCAKFLDILGILNISDISGISNNTLIILIIILYIIIYIVISSLSRVIRIYIIFFTILSILISILKTNNLDDIFKYTLNLALNSRLR